jgi:hypothetical protein
VIIETEDEVLVTTREATEKIGQFADKYLPKSTFICEIEEPRA